MRFYVILLGALLSGCCNSYTFEGNSAGPRHEGTVGRYRIAELREINMQGRLSCALRVVDALPESFVNAIAEKRRPDVFSSQLNSIPVRVTVENGTNTLWDVNWMLINGYTFGLVPRMWVGESTCSVTVEAFGVSNSTEVVYREAGRTSFISLLGFIAPAVKDEASPHFSFSGWNAHEYDAGGEYCRVFAETIVDTVAQILSRQETSGAFLGAKSNLRPDPAIGKKYGILLDRGLISKEEYEQAIVRYAETRDPSRVAIDIGKLRDQGVISQEDYRQEILKAFGAEVTKLEGAGK